MTDQFRVTRRVEFCETDQAGIMHFSNYFRFMETAEHAFVRSLGYSVTLPGFNPPLGLPRVHAACDYRAPLRFEDEVEIHLLVREKKTRSLTYEFRFTNLSASPPREVARGSVVVVCVALQPDGTMKAVPLPPAFADQIQAAPPELFA